MIPGKYNFDPIPQGTGYEAETIQLMDGTTPIDLTGATICMQARLNSNSSVAHTFSTTITDPTNGIITINSFIVEMPPARYDYDIKITPLVGLPYRPLEGIFHVLSGISRCQ